MENNSTENNSIENENPDINKLTLELLINKNHYNKYLSKNDPIKYKEQQEYFDKIRKYRNKIIDLTNDLIQDPKIQINNELNEIFHNYMRTCIRYFDMKEIEINSEKKYTGDEESDEDDTLFHSVKNNNFIDSDRYEDGDGDGDELNEKLKRGESIKSFWGKEKVVKSSMSNYDIRMFSNKR